MKTIEERAREEAISRCGGDYSTRDVCSSSTASAWWGIYCSYIRIAEEQKQIDIDKACECFCHNCCGNRTYNSCCSVCGGFKSFKKSLEE